jgi:hypothetical protein
MVELLMCGVLLGRADAPAHVLLESSLRVRDSEQERDDPAADIGQLLRRQFADLSLLRFKVLGIFVRVLDELIHVLAPGRKNVQK